MLSCACQEKHYDALKLGLELVEQDHHYLELERVRCDAHAAWDDEDGVVHDVEEEMSGCDKDEFRDILDNIRQLHKELREQSFPSAEHEMMAVSNARPGHVLASSMEVDSGVKERPEPHETGSQNPQKSTSKMQKLEKVKKLSNSIQQNSQNTVTGKREKHLASKIKVDDLTTALTQQPHDGTNQLSPSDDASLVNGYWKF